MIQGWITCALVLIATLCINCLILEAKSNLQEQINILREELRATRTSLDITQTRNHNSTFHKHQQYFEISEFPRVEKRIHF